VNISGFLFALSRMIFAEFKETGSTMPSLKPKTEIQNILPRRAKSLLKMQAKSTNPTFPREQDFLSRCNELGNRARRSFHNDGPGGNYEGF
jgi:hypothetical protein